jgi:hypothetical protein
MAHFTARFISGEISAKAHITTRLHFTIRETLGKIILTVA